MINHETKTAILHNNFCRLMILESKQRRSRRKEMYLKRGFRIFNTDNFTQLRISIKGYDKSSDVILSGFEATSESVEVEMYRVRTTKVLANRIAKELVDDLYAKMKSGTEGFDLDYWEEKNLS